jgi:hypothetical protein
MQSMQNCQQKTAWYLKKSHYCPTVWPTHSSISRDFILFLEKSHRRICSSISPSMDMESPFRGCATMGLAKNRSRSEFKSSAYVFCKEVLIESLLSLNFAASTSASRSRRPIQSTRRDAPEPTSADLRAQVLEARARQARRFGPKGTQANGRMTLLQVWKFCALKPEAMALLKAAF